MSFQKDQFRKLIKDVLTSLDLYSKEAVELLMMTAAQESHLGKYLEQVKGPALGVFQMEPNTHEDIWDSYLAYKPKLKNKVNDLIATHAYVGVRDLNQRGNIIYQIAMARVYYLRFSEKLPHYTDLHRMAKYYKKYWNTKLGKATVQEALNNYNRFC